MAKQFQYGKSVCSPILGYAIMTHLGLVTLYRDFHLSQP